MLPFIFRSDSFTLPTYLVFNSLVFCLGVLWAARRADQKGLDRNQILDLCIWIMVGGFIGARFLHIVWEQPQLYLKHPEFIFHFWLGGFVFYGGVVGALLAGAFYVRRKKISFLKHADFFTPIGSLGYAFGRLGCLAAGCCYGRPTTLPWGITFPPGVEAPTGLPLHPTQIYAFLMELVVFSFVYRADKRKHGPGQIFGLWLMLHGTGRIILEYFRDDYRGGQPAGLSFSSWVSVLVIAVGVWLYIRAQKLNN